MQRESPVTVYDPFARGPFPVGVRTIHSPDIVRSRIFPVEVWYPASMRYQGQDLLPDKQDVLPAAPTEARRAQMAVRDAAVEPGMFPLVVFSHGSGRRSRLMATFLCTHLASHGYLVAALDHSETITPELAPQEHATDEEKARRVQAVVANRVPDIRFLLDIMLNDSVWESDSKADPNRIGIVGYSFGGWTALAVTAVEWRIRAVTALAPAGSSRPKPGILPASVTFHWGRDVPTLYLAAENDVMTPLAGIRELFERTPATKRLIILRRSDHLHFRDNVEEEHEYLRNMQWTGELAWIPEEMRPIGELCSGEQAYSFTRGLTLCHMDAFLRSQSSARRVLDHNIEDFLAQRGIESIAPDIVV